MRTVVAIFCLAVALLAGASLPLIARDKQEKKSDPPKTESLEALQARALQQSLDLKVAEAKLRLAQAELERNQAKIRAQVAALHNDLQAAIAGEKEGLTRKTRAEHLYAQKVISAEDLGAAILTWAKLKNERVSIAEKLRLVVDGVPIDADPKK